MDVWSNRGCPPDEGKAVKTRHGDIHEGNVGMSLREECKCFLTIAGLADHGHMWQTFQQRAYACTNQIVIINEDYSYRYDCNRAHLAALD